MGLLATRWEASYQGHNITVSRNEVLRGFTLEWDGRELARRTWSLVGLGELHATAELDGRSVEVHVSLELPDSIDELDGVCRLTVDGSAVPVRHVR